MPVVRLFVVDAMFGDFPWRTVAFEHGGKYYTYDPDAKRVLTAGETLEEALREELRQWVEIWEEGRRKRPVRAYEVLAKEWGEALKKPFKLVKMAYWKEEEIEEISPSGVLV